MDGMACRMLVVGQRVCECEKLLKVRSTEARSTLKWYFNGQTSRHIIKRSIGGVVCPWEDKGTRVDY